MKASKTVITTFIAALLCSTALHAQETQSPQLQILSGGIGDGEMDSMKEAQKDYSLKLIYSQPNGEYLANVGVKIRDQKKSTLVDTASQGPVVLINLKPGTYTLVSATEEESKTQKIVVGSSGLKTYSIHLRSE